MSTDGPQRQPSDLAPPTPVGADAVERVAEELQSGRGRLIRRAAGSSPLLMLGVLVGMVLIFSILKSQTFPTAANTRNVLQDASTLLVMATAMTFVMISAGIDLSVGSVLVFAGVCAAKVMEGHDGAGTVLLGLVVAVAAGVAWGIINGLAITKLRVPALITTLGTTGAALGVARLVTNGNDVRDVPVSLIKVTTGSFLGLNWIVWISLVVVVIGALILNFTRFGRHTYIIGSNAEAARRAGINVDRHLMWLYGWSGALAGLAGMLSVTRFATTTIAGHGTDSLQVITGVVLGGTSLFGGIGSVAGSVVGIFIPSVLNNGFVITNVEPFWQEVAIGFILILAVYIDQLKRSRRDRA